MGFHYRTKKAAIVEDVAEYVLSDGEPDRAGDIIEPSGWQISETKALFNHHRDAIIGRWENVRVAGGQLIGRLILAEAGTTPTVDMVRAFIRQNLLDSVSVGFRSLEAVPINPRDPWGPTHFQKTELLEASLVTIAANPRARRIAKQYLSDDDASRLFAASSENGGDRRPSPGPGKSAETHRQQRGGPPMKISEGIIARQNQLVAIKDKLAAIAKRTEQNNCEMSDDDAAEQETLEAEQADAEKQLTRLKALETDLKIEVINRSADPPAAREPGRDPGADPIRAAARDAKGFDLLVRTALCTFLGHVERKPPLAVMQERYKDHRTFRELETVVKTATAPAMTNVVGWAAELVGANVQALLESLAGVAIYPRVASRGVSVTFDGQVPIPIPARQYGTVPGGAAPTDRNKRLSGAFVGQGQPIPVRQALFTAIMLNPYKMAVISTFTREMALASTPAMEQIIREAIVEDTAWALDMALLSDEAAIPNIRPAGIFNGVVALTPAAAGAGAALADLKALLGAVIGKGGGRRLLFILNPLQALTLSTTSEGGTFLFRDEMARGRLLSTEFISSITVPPGEVYLIDAADFASGTGAPVFDVSDQATLHMDDGTYLADFTAPAVKPIVGAAAAPPAVADIATPVRSLWQTASIGVRMLMLTSWAMRRGGMVAHMEGVNW